VQINSNGHQLYEQRTTSLDTLLQQQKFKQQQAHYSSTNPIFELVVWSNKTIRELTFESILSFVN